MAENTTLSMNSDALPSIFNPTEASESRLILQRGVGYYNFAHAIYMSSIYSLCLASTIVIDIVVLLVLTVHQPQDQGVGVEKLFDSPLLQIGAASLLLFIPIEFAISFNIMQIRGEALRFRGSASRRVLHGLISLFLLPAWISFFLLLYFTWTQSPNYPISSFRKVVNSNTFLIIDLLIFLFHLSRALLLNLEWRGDSLFSGSPRWDIVFSPFHKKKRCDSMSTYESYYGSINTNLSDHYSQLEKNTFDWNTLAAHNDRYKSSKASTCIITSSERDEQAVEQKIEDSLHKQKKSDSRQFQKHQRENKSSALSAKSKKISTQFNGVGIGNTNLNGEFISNRSSNVKGYRKTNKVPPDMSFRRRMETRRKRIFKNVGASDTSEGESDTSSTSNRNAANYLHKGKFPYLKIKRRDPKKNTSIHGYLSNPSTPDRSQFSSLPSSPNFTTQAQEPNDAFLLPPPTQPITSRPVFRLYPRQKRGESKTNQRIISLPVERKPQNRRSKSKWRDKYNIERLQPCPEEKISLQEDVAEYKHSKHFQNH